MEHAIPTPQPTGPTIRIRRSAERGFQDFGGTANGIYRALHPAGDAVEYLLDAGHGAWIQVVRGSLRVFGARLGSGDGAGITGAERVPLEFDSETELLLFDLGMNAPMIWW